MEPEPSAHARSQLERNREIVIGSLLAAAAVAFLGFFFYFVPPVHGVDLRRDGLLMALVLIPGCWLAVLALRLITGRRRWVDGGILSPTFLVLVGLAVLILDVLFLVYNVFPFTAILTLAGFTGACFVLARRRALLQKAKPCALCGAGIMAVEYMVDAGTHGICKKCVLSVRTALHNGDHLSLGEEGSCALCDCALPSGASTGSSLCAECVEAAFQLLVQANVPGLDGAESSAC